MHEFKCCQQKQLFLFFYIEVMFFNSPRCQLTFYKSTNGSLLFLTRNNLISYIFPQGKCYSRQTILVFIPAQETAVFDFALDNGCFSILWWQPLFFFILPRICLFFHLSTDIGYFFISLQIEADFYLSSENVYFLLQTTAFFPQKAVILIRLRK